MTLAPQVRVHLQEVERLAILLRALQGRLDRTHKLLQRTRDTDQKVRKTLEQRCKSCLFKCTIGLFLFPQGYQGYYC